MIIPDSCPAELGESTKNSKVGPLCSKGKGSFSVMRTCHLSLGCPGCMSVGEWEEGASIRRSLPICTYLSIFVYGLSVKSVFFTSVVEESNTDYRMQRPFLPYRFCYPEVVH